MSTPENAAAAACGYRDLKEGVLSAATAARALESGRIVALRGRRWGVLIGDGTLVKVNTSIGCSQASRIGTELDKLAELSALDYRPDLMMDLSIVRPKRPLYAAMVEEFGGPIGTLPHYLCYSRAGGIDPGALLDEIEAQAEAGVAWMTLHVAVDRELCELARRTRTTPITARGGGMVVADLYLRDASVGVLDELLPDILSVMRRRGVALSLGTTFRPAGTGDALDAVHRAEITKQGEYIDEARRQGVPVLLEAVGHMRLGQCREFASIVRDQHGYRLPIMTLGPIPTDAAVGEDHVANAVGGAFLAMQGGTHVLNSITREEHTGGVPAKASIVEGLRAARVAAHAVNLSLHDATAADHAVQTARDAHYTCVVDGGLFGMRPAGSRAMGCSRCASACPLRLNFDLEHGTGTVARARRGDRPLI